MPAIMTHDFFGRDVLAALDRSSHISFDDAQRRAFLLGNQGPDPFFYLIASPTSHAEHTIGTLLHRERTTDLLKAFEQALSFMSSTEYPIACAYVEGFFCHYALDSTAHPYVYALEYLICDAGVQGLTRENSAEVHAVIESEIDEIELYRHLGTTIDRFDPAANILVIDQSSLDCIAKLYMYTLLTVYSIAIGPDVFPRAVTDFRRMQRFFYSPRGIKRAVVGSLEESFRPYSLYRSMSHRNNAAHTSWIFNTEHHTWTQPFTGNIHHESFDELYAQAQQHVQSFLLARSDQQSRYAYNTKEPATHCETGQSREQIDQSIDAFTHNLNFSGEPDPSCSHEDEQR
ncbi:MAG: zinc dependent phospholipase C family protein [Eggerthellaceae bacterium]|jgi:hypothetical protein|nr:zinc dependent phospholipase C family protein [Eggerthellaceae bacterium]MCH4221384.1 zinc dependent phospholipase C family protein [Eggerthellaceae bacterium]